MPNLGELEGHVAALGGCERDPEKRKLPKKAGTHNQYAPDNT